MSAKRSYDESRYMQARRDLEQEIRSELHRDFERSAPVELMELARHAMAALEAIAQSVQKETRP